MKVITCASRKGGGGKTVCARHLAVSALRGGYRVAIVDLDPMAGLSRWWRRRPEDGVELVDLAPVSARRDTSEGRFQAAVQAAASLGVAVARLRSAGHDLLIVDTPPAADRIVAAAVAAADVVVVPVRPSPDDLDAVGETVDLVTTAGRPMVFVVNSATRKARLTADAAIALSQHGTVCPSIIHRADIFAASALDGRTVAEVEPGGKPAYEIDGLWTYVAGKVGMTAAKKTPIARSAKATLKVVDSSPDERMAG